MRNTPYPYKRPKKSPPTRRQPRSPAHPIPRRAHGSEALQPRRRANMPRKLNDALSKQGLPPPQKRALKPPVLRGMFRRRSRPASGWPTSSHYEVSAPDPEAPKRGTLHRLGPRRRCEPRTQYVALTPHYLPNSRHQPTAAWRISGQLEFAAMIEGRPRSGVGVIRVRPRRVHGASPTSVAGRSRPHSYVLE